MINSIIFDLDNTLVDTNNLRAFRDTRNWNMCYSNVLQTNLIFNPNDLSKYAKIGIVTNSPRKYAIELLNYHKIHFDCLIAYHDVTRRKPHPEPFIKCLNSLSITPTESIGIGDHFNDTIAANSAAMYSIGVTWGDSTFYEHQTNNADLIISNPLDLNEYLIKIVKEELTK